MLVLRKGFGKPNSVAAAPFAWQHPVFFAKRRGKGTGVRKAVALSHPLNGILPVGKVADGVIQPQVGQIFCNGNAHIGAEKLG